MGLDAVIDPIARLAEEFFDGVEIVEGSDEFFNGGLEFGIHEDAFSQAFREVKPFAGFFLAFARAMILDGCRA